MACLPLPWTDCMMPQIYSIFVLDAMGSSENSGLPAVQTKPESSWVLELEHWHVVLCSGPEPSWTWFSFRELLNSFVHCPLAAGEPRSLPSACPEHTTWAGAVGTSQPATWWHRNGWIKVVPGHPLPWASMSGKMVSPLFETGVQGDLGHVT